MEAIDLDTSASGSGFFSGDPKKHDDLKAMLDSSKESLKLEGTTFSNTFNTTFGLTF